MVSLAFQSISEQAYNLLLNMIVNQELKFGQRLIEEQLAARLNISRTPLRKAISRLATGGLVDIEPRRGARIKQFAVKDVSEVYDIRSALEGVAAKLAAGRIPHETLGELKERFSSKDSETLAQADADLHHLVLDYCDNSRLTELLGDLRNLIQVFRIAGYASRKRSQDATVEHIRIIDALSAGEPHHAETQMRMHIEATKTAILSSCKPEEER